MNETEKPETKRYLGLNKYQIIIIGLLVSMLFLFSDNSIFKRMKYDAQIEDIKEQIEQYRNQTEMDRAKLNEIQSDKENLEKFARETYLMKKADEDVFIVE